MLGENTTTSIHPVSSADVSAAASLPSFKGWKDFLARTTRTSQQPSIALIGKRRSEVPEELGVVVDTVKALGPRGAFRFVTRGQHVVLFPDPSEGGRLVGRVQPMRGQDLRSPLDELQRLDPPVLARAKGVALPQLAWSLRTLGRVRPAREYGEQTLRATPEAQKSSDYKSILQSAASGLQYLHDRGALHGDIRPQNIILALDGRWLLADVLLGPDTDEDRAGDVRALCQTLIDAFCTRHEDDPPALQPAIRVGMGYREAANLEALFTWLWFRLRDADFIEQSADLLIRINRAISELRNDRLEPVLPTEWLNFIKAFDQRVDDHVYAELPQLVHGIAPAQVESRLDAEWEQYIVASAKERLHRVSVAREQFKRESAETQSTTPADDLEQLVAEDILLTYEDEERPNLEALVSRARDSAEELRERVLAQPAFAAVDVASRLEVDAEQLQALLRSGRLVGVRDHDTLLLPSFQFAAERALVAVSEISAAQGASYPSWLWASGWFTPLEPYEGKTAAELVATDHERELIAHAREEDRAS
jgi:hypothetical protein